jgi:hypothetical protein
MTSQLLRKFIQVCFVILIMFCREIHLNMYELCGAFYVYLIMFLASLVEVLECIKTHKNPQNIIRSQTSHLDTQKDVKAYAACHGQINSLEDCTNTL